MRYVKKAFGMLASAIAVLLISGFISLKPIAQGPVLAQPASSACNDITGSTTGVAPPAGDPARPDGVFDSGSTVFSVPSPPHNACVETAVSTMPVTPPIPGQYIKGWAWNTNAGWVSFKCLGNQNTTANDCGTINYSTIIKSANKELAGFAWNDNIGWISLSCTGGSNAGTACGGMNYGVKVASADDTAYQNQCGRAATAGDLYGWAWTDTVGWINFCGVHVDLATNITASVFITPVPSSGTTTIYANNSDAYKISIKFTDSASGSNPLTITESGGNFTVTDSSGTTHTVNNILYNFENSLKADQVTACGGTSPSSCLYNGAVLPESSTTTGTTVEALVKAIAPTNLNNRLAFSSVSMNIDGATRTVFYTDQNRNFTFRPAVEVTQIKSWLADDEDSGSSTTKLMAWPDGTSTVEISAYKAASFSPSSYIISQLYDCSKDMFDFRFDPAEWPSPFSENKNTYLTNYLTSICSGYTGDIIPLSNDANVAGNAYNTASPITLNFVTSIEATPEGPAYIAEIDAGLQTIVFYNAAVDAVNIPVRYYSHFVRGVENADAQAALIRGDIRIDVITQEGLPIVSTEILQSIGEHAQSRREPFYRVIRNLLGSVELEPAGSEITNMSVVLDKNYLQENDTNINQPGIYYFNRQNLKQASTPLENQPCSIILKDMDMMAPTETAWDGDRTIVAEGCDFFIDSDILPKDKKLGIIALEDLYISGGRRGGNIYICGTTTDIEANIVADGTVYSYGGLGPDSTTICGNTITNKNLLINNTDGTPRFEASAIREVLKNQLTITGSLISNNTYGGSVSNPPQMCDGSIARTSAEIAQSRLCDLNFLRSAKLRRADPTDSGYDSEKPFCWTDDVNLSTTWDNPSNRCDIRGGVVNIKYQAPTSQQPVFKAVR